MAASTPETLLNLDYLRLNNELVDKTPLTQRRYTPYTKSNQRAQVLTKTPLPKFHQKQRQKLQEPKRSRRQQRSVHEHSNISTTVVNKTWRVYRVSPLYCFKTDKQSLKLCEKRLNSFLAVETCKAAEIHSRIKLKSVFRKVDGESEADYGIEIKVLRNEGKENAPKEEMTVVLCCGGSINENKTMNLNGDLTSLPVCLIKGPVLLKDAFLQWLEGQYGCRASMLLFSPTDLAWLVSLCAGIGEPTNSVELTYTVPAVIPGLDTIYFKMDAKDTRKIWNAVHDSKQHYFTNDEAVRFLRSMEAHFYHHSKIHLDQMQLTTVATSVAFIGQEGRLKILQEPYVCYILQQLFQLANF